MAKKVEWKITCNICKKLVATVHGTTDSVAMHQAADRAMYRHMREEHDGITKQDCR